MCNRHYQMQYRGLDPNLEEARRVARAEAKAKKACAVSGCPFRDPIISGYCSSHYHYWKRTGQIPTHVVNTGQTPTCTVEDCGRSTKDGGLDLCPAHYQRYRKYGDAGDVEIQEKHDQGLTCRIDGCERPPQAHNLCHMHYRRAWRGNDPELEPDRSVPVEDRFWPKVNKDGPIPPHRPRLGPCWVWIAAAPGFGYGTIGVGTDHNERAHRVSWRLHNGEIPTGLHVLHRCDNPPCVRPDHLFLGTPADNSRDMSEKGRAPGSRKLTWEIVDQIRLELTQGATRSELADKYGVSAANIWCIGAGKSWDPAKRRSMNE